MKIPQSVRVLYQDLLPKYELLKKEVDKLVLSRKPERWHFESRVKGEESFALKLETARVRDLSAPEDFFACTIVVENHSRIADAENFVAGLFAQHKRRPPRSDVTHLEPFSFDFDDLRLFVKWIDDPAQKPTGLAGLLFEVQVKTFLQHAWGIATHDFVYKTDDVDWSSSRIAYQVKAMLENAELSIGQASKLTGSAMLQKTDDLSADLRAMIVKIKQRWPSERLPKDLRRLAFTFGELMNKLDLGFDELWSITDKATARGEGANTLNLSPYAAVLAALIREKGARLFDRLLHTKRDFVFVPAEIAVPSVPKNVSAKLIRTRVSGSGPP